MADRRKPSTMMRLFTETLAPKPDMGAANAAAEAKAKAAAVQKTLARLAREHPNAVVIPFVKRKVR